MSTQASFSKSAADSNNAFAFKLLAQIKSNSQATNIFVSPLSISQALKMAMNGASANTFKQMASTLQLGDSDQSQINKDDKALVDSISTSDQSFVKNSIKSGLGDPAFKLQLANSLWGNKNITFNPDFISACHTAYNAEVRSADFSKRETVTEINKWTSDKTQGKIPSIIQQLKESDFMVLLNATYFKAPWEKTFNKNQSKEMPFHGQPGTSKVMMMHRADKMFYAENAKYQAIKLPYADHQSAMYVVLPRENETVDSVLKSFDAESYKKFASNFQNKTGELFLPKFKFDYQKKLGQTLSSLGMPDAFSQQKADFSHMVKSGQKPFISEVIHKSFVDVNEEGTEAAAVTAIMMVAAP